MEWLIRSYFVLIVHLCWLDIREEKGGERELGGKDGDAWKDTRVHTHTHTIIKAVIVGIVFSITKPTTLYCDGQVSKTLILCTSVYCTCNPEQAHTHFCVRDCVSNLNINIQVGTDLCLCHWSQARFPH